MDYFSEHQSLPPLKNQAVFSTACEFIQQQLPGLLRRVLRNTQNHAEWPLSDKDKEKLIKLLEQKERIVVSSFMFHVNQNLSNFATSGAAPLRIVPRLERSDDHGIYAQFNESLMQRFSSIVNRPPIPLTENPLHLFNLKQSWDYAINSLFVGDTERSILARAFEKQLAPNLGSFYRLLDRLLFDAGVLGTLPISRLNLRNPQDYSDTIKSVLGDIGIEFSHLMIGARQQQLLEQEEARKLQAIRVEIKDQLADDHTNLDKRQRYFFDNLWMPYLTAVATKKGTASKAWRKAIGHSRQFNQLLTPRASRNDVRTLLEGWEDANKVIEKALNKLQATSHQKQVIRSFFERSFDTVLKHSVDNTARSIKASRPLSAQTEICREAEEFRRLFVDIQLPASQQQLDRIASPPPQQSLQTTSGELREGDWAEMKQPRKSRNLMIKLAWKAADLSKYIFVDRSGGRVCELNHAELQKKLDSGDIKPVNQTSQRAAHQNLSTLRSL